MPQDILIHMGDVIFDRAKELAGIMDSLPGTKILVRGNHDRKSGSWYTRHGFHFVCDEFRIGTTLFTHKPVPIREGIEFNIHGHFHNTAHRTNEPEFNVFYGNRHILLAVELNDYKPYNLAKLLVVRKKQFEVKMGVIRCIKSGKLSG